MGLEKSRPGGHSYEKQARYVELKNPAAANASADVHDERAEH